MSTITKAGMTRREILKGSSALVFSFSLSAAVAGRAGVAQEATSAATPVTSKLEGAEPRNLEFEQIDSWLAITDDGRVIVYAGKVELGTGVKTALSQIVAEELNVSFDQIEMIMGDTWLTPDQGTTAGSNTIRAGGSVLRNVAAEARVVLLERASEQLEQPVGQLVVDDGVVGAQGGGTVAYWDLIGDGFDTTVDPEATTTQGSPTAPVEDPAVYNIVGESIPRVDIPPKLTGQLSYVQDLRLEGMVHGRPVRPWLRTPSGVGATLQDIDESSVSDIPGLIQIVRDGNFLGVVAEEEYQAIRASEQLDVTWEEQEPQPPQDDLFNFIREVPVVEDQDVASRGDIEMGFSQAAQTIEATYQFPFQAHASMGPSCAVADVGSDQATVYSSTQGVYGLRGALAGLLDMDEEAIRVVHLEGAGCYGHNGFDDAAADAALLSRAVGRPVRVQWMRQDEFAWEPKGTAMSIDVRGGLDDEGNVVAWDYQLWSQPHSTRPGGEAGNLLDGQLVEEPSEATDHFRGGGSRNAPHMYTFPNNQVTAHSLELFVLRASALRSLGGLPNTTAVESFIDELAGAAGVDPVEFRLNYLEDERAIDVVNRAAETAGWESRLGGAGATPASATPTASGGAASGRGFALSRYESEFAYVATVADVDVDQASGEVRVNRVVVAHDCGLIINPNGLMNQIEGCVIQGVSRALKEEITWDDHQVTSLDWATYPILTFSEVPTIEIELIDRPDQPAVGAGEPAICNIPAAIANAIFDATGARVRTLPFTPDRVMAALG